MLIPYVNMTIVAALAASLFLSTISCAPMDEALTPRVQAGDRLTQKGERLDSCYSDKPDWDRLELHPSQDPLIKKGVVHSYLSAGTYNCFRVGSVVDLKDGKDGADRGDVRITRIEVLRYSDITESHVQASGLTMDKMNDVIRQRLDKDNLVTLTHFEFVDGSGKSSPEEENGLGFEPLDLNEVGAMFPDCDPKKGFYKEVRMDHVSHESIKEGLIQLHPELRPDDLRVCYQVGTEVKLVDQTDPENKVNVAEAVITRLVQKPLSEVTEEDALGFNMTRADLFTRFLQSNETISANSRIVLVYFDVVKPSAEGESQ